MRAAAEADESRTPSAVSLAQTGLEDVGAWEVCVRDEPSVDWDSFVMGRPEAHVYLLSGWIDLARRVFGHRTYFIEGRARGELVGVLPVVQQRSMLLGNFATSLPFFNYGGALCADERLANVLMERGCAVARDLGCSYLEFRDVRLRQGSWSIRTDKVAMELRLPPKFSDLAQKLGSKLRAQVKRAERENASVRVGGAALVNDFYDVFAQNMRDLGTPVYPRRFFSAIVERFPQHCRLVVVDRRGAPAAAGFVVWNGLRAEIPWAACLAEAKPLGFNMKLYWEVLGMVVEQGCTTFDFGRSTVDAGTYRFKKQWGAEPVQLYWHRWSRSTLHQNAIPGTSRAMNYAARVWRRLPLPIANALGPIISPKLPW